MKFYNAVSLKIFILYLIFIPRNFSNDIEKKDS